MPTKNKISKILFVEQNQDGTVGGSYYSLLYLVRALGKNKYDPVVMFYENNHMIQRFVGENCRTIIYNKPVGKTFNPFHPILNLPTKMAQKAYNFVNVSLVPLVNFIHFIINHNIDLIHLNNSASMGWEWLLASKLLGKKCITHERGFMKFSRLAIKRSRHFDKIICVSNAVRKSLHMKGLGKNVITIYDGMDLNEFAGRIKKNAESVRNEFGVYGSTPLIGMVGNFREWKGQRIVVESLAIIKDKYPDIVCLLVGDVATTNAVDIKYFQEIKEEINTRHLYKNIIITGYRDDVPDLMNACDIIIHSSVEPEPFGMVVIEAMLLKKPVIATKHGGPKEIINDGVSGYLIPPGNPGILAEKIDFLLQYSEIGNKLGENAFCRVAEKFSMERFSKSINRLYENIFH
jgi:glycosyltransferase involved in cell wall biosynthesis